MLLLSSPRRVKIPSRIVLTTMTLCSIIVLGSSVHSSDPTHIDITEARSVAPIEVEAQALQSKPSIDDRQQSKSSRSNDVDARQRTSRMFQQTSGQQQVPIESYAAAYAAANSDQHSNHHISQQSASDTNTFASFGETAPAASGSTSTSRQFASPNEYNSAGYMLPNNLETSHSQSSGINNYHANHHMQNHYYKTPSTLPLGYPSNSYERYPMSSYYDRVGHHGPALTPFFSASPFHPGGLVSSATNALSHWTNGFSISEIICGLVAISIGAVILGAPFFLIYLALMGNFSGSGSLSLTNPTQGTAGVPGTSTTVNGRRKRLAVFEAININEKTSRYPDLALIAESVLRHISPLIDSKQLSRTLRHLVNSTERYSSTIGRKETIAKKQSS